FGHWDDADVREWRWPLLAGAIGVLPIVTGTWLGSALAHVRGRGSLWTWGGLMFVVITIAAALVAIDQYDTDAWAARRGGVPWTGGPGTYALMLAMWWGQSMVVLAMMLAVTMIAMPLGAGPRRLAAWFRRWRWGWRRRRRREGRIAL
ncbi:MAG: hypothetical protein ACYTGG_13640, partial [Planctomycetota bacterium]